MSRAFKSAFCLLLFLTAWLSSGPAAAQSAAETELQMKAGFIYNFALFVQWPETVFSRPEDPLIICLAANSSARAAFDPLHTKTIQNRPVSVRTCADNESCKPCQIIYIPADTPKQASELLKKVSGPGVLTVGDADGFSRLGGIIGFYRENNKLRFEINTDAAQRAGLRLSSQLLKLAKIISGSTSP